ncbi:nucleotidyltransferase [Levilactobacillus tangyuanensis]|uniref:tRNA(Met) cytidine acetate ligase n=1 Tax=Levilactobacillus tangyuanensis TaxID=2486021 RepID=A0ABW1TPG6_9LACO|nr:nucleotidyltransferase [Levilactobacillus tangyuanensis]
MQAVGIIAEYNPFHNGHAYQIRQAKQQTGADAVVVAMSGNWVQRGEPALLDKWQRARTALAGGADLVVELPTASAIQPADLFARGGVAILAALQCHWLAFGTEHPGMDYRRLMDHLPTDPATFKRFDQTYASLFQGYLREQTGIMLNSGNDILGFFYALANRRAGNHLSLVPLARKGSDHNDSTIVAGTDFASATAIRQAILAGDLAQIARVVPAATLAALRQGPLVDWEQLWPQLRYLLMTSAPTDLAKMYQITEGVEYRLKRAAVKSSSFTDFMQAVKTKRYTYTRLQRQASYLYNQAHPTEMQQQPQYLRVLGYSAAGQQYLHAIKKTVEWPLVSRADREWQRGEGALDVRVGQLRTLLTGIPQDDGRIPIKLSDSE